MSGGAGTGAGQGSVAERRLRPIYDWLDNGNNKKALQEADKVLRKTPTLQSARALRALALLRLGRAAESQGVLAALAEECPSDDTTLQAMTISYRESQQLRKVCELYELAVKAESGNEELHSHLFMSYVRVADFKSQQRTAVALYKVAPKNPYYFWAVMSIVLQAKETDDSVKKGVLLSLAQRMVDKFIADHKMEAQQEARLYIMILQLQNKYEDILKFMETPLYSNLVPGSIAQATIPYLQKLGKWRQVNIVCKKLLWEALDRWDYYQPYLDSVFELMKGESVGVENGAVESADDSAEKCHEFICQLTENIPVGRTLRGPYLARLELYKRLLAAERDPVGLVGDALDLCKEYLRAFAHKPCCVADLKPYLGMVPAGEREERCREFLACLGMDEHTMPETVEEVQRHVSCLGAWRLCAPWRPEETAALAATLRAHYLRALARGLAPCTTTEFGAADAYAVLAAHHYYRVAMDRRSSAPVLEALSLLEFVLAQSPSNFHCKLIGLKLYHLLGNGGAAEGMYERLEVKHIQLQSLGWLHSARLLSAGLPARALRLHADTQRFHTHHTRDSVDHLTYSYKYGTFEKLCELMEWRERVEHCAWCAAATLERALLELLTGAAAVFNQPAPSPPLDTLRDNRDLSVMIDWELPREHDARLAPDTFRHELAHVALREALVGCVALGIELAAAATGNVHPSSEPPERLDKAALLRELEECVCKMEAGLEALQQECRAGSPAGAPSLSAPFPSRIIALVNSPVPYRELYACCARLVGALAGGGEPAAARRQCARATALVDASRLALEAQLRERRLASAGDVLWVCRENLEDVANYVEFIGIATFELGVCGELAAPAGRRGRRRGAGGAGAAAPADGETAALLARLQAAVQEGAALVSRLLDEWPEPTVPDDLEDMFSKLSAGESPAEPLRDRLQRGHRTAVTELRSVLARKPKN